MASSSKLASLILRGRCTLKKRNKNYVSEIDLFLEELRQVVPESESQSKERQQYERLNRLRDQAQSES
jgi:hypothetical protein